MNDSQRCIATDADYFEWQVLLHSIPKLSNTVRVRKRPLISERPYKQESFALEQIEGR